MAPEELLSIKNFDRNKENKSKENASESEDGENQDTSGQADQANKGKNKRTINDTQGSGKKKPNDKEVACKQGKKVDKLKADSRNSTGNIESPGNKLQKRKRSISNEHETDKEEVEPRGKKLKSDSEGISFCHGHIAVRFFCDDLSKIMLHCLQ